MGLLDEAAGTQGTPLSASLVAGVEAISYTQKITFTPYVRVVLPLDGFIFWVKDTSSTPINVKGSFHYASDASQEEASNITMNRVIFTAESEIQDLNDIEPNKLFLGSFNGVRFAFNSRGSYYKQANLFHYVGHSIPATMLSQFVDDPTMMDGSNVVSNSLPIWLSITTALNVTADEYGMPTFTLFPSFLTPQNEPTPYAAVHIDPRTTRGIGSAPFLDTDLSHYQLCTETAKLTFYGMNNDQVLSFVDYVNQYSVLYDTIGMMNIPVVRDEKEPMTDFSTISMKKTVEFEVSYYQSVARSTARQLIQQVLVTFIPNLNRSS